MTTQAIQERVTRAGYDVERVEVWGDGWRVYIPNLHRTEKSIQKRCDKAGLILRAWGMHVRNNCAYIVVEAA